jgi:cytochrome P450
MLHNEETYPDPFNFVPERYLKNGKIDKSVKNPMDMAFGFGRRFVHLFAHIRKSCAYTFI